MDEEAKEIKKYIYANHTKITTIYDKLICAIVYIEDTAKLERAKDLRILKLYAQEASEAREREYSEKRSKPVRHWPELRQEIIDKLAAGEDTIPYGIQLCVRILVELRPMRTKELYNLHWSKVKDMNYFDTGVKHLIIQNHKNVRSMSTIVSECPKTTLVCELRKIKNKLKGEEKKQRICGDMPYHKFQRLMFQIIGIPNNEFRRSYTTYHIVNHEKGEHYKQCLKLSKKLGHSIATQAKYYDYN